MNLPLKLTEARITRLSMPPKFGELAMFSWCPGRDLNPHSPYGETDFKSVASAGFATRALLPHCIHGYGDNRSRPQ